MGSILWPEVYYDAFRILIPEHHNRIPITWNALPYAIVSLVPFALLACLSRRPDTYLIRLLLLPIVVVMSIGTAYRFVWTDPRLNVYNWGQGLSALGITAKAMDLALSPQGLLKCGESWPGEKLMEPSTSSIMANGNGHLDDNVQLNSSTDSPLSRRLLLALRDIFEVTTTMRGIGWQFGQGVYVPQEWRPLDRNAFLRINLLSFLWNFQLLDFLESAVKLFPGVGSTSGATIFYPDLPPLQRYSVSTVIHILSGCGLLAGFSMVYSLSTFISVAFLHMPPSAWPPVMDNPWISDSMHTFWAKRWHQILRRTFIVFGGYPGKFFLGNTGMVLGAFVASGLYHECAMYSMMKGWDWRVPLFFAMQGPILILERLWSKVTGKRVGGWTGMLWVYLNIFIFSQPMMDSWHSRGLAGGMVIPPMISPVRQLLLPALQPVLEQWNINMTKI